MECIANRKYKAVQGPNRSKDREIELINKKSERKENKRCLMQEIN